MEIVWVVTQYVWVASYQSVERTWSSIFRKEINVVSSLKSLTVPYHINQLFLN